MGSLQVKLPIFLLIYAVCLKISDQTLTCGNNNFFIQYPFQLLQEGQKPHHKSHHHHHDLFILQCNSQGFVVQNLPFSGEFFVRDIDYFEHKIQLYDPGNCLPGRLKNLSLASSPFVAVTYQNYTFFSCHPESLTKSSRNFSVISCLSNSTSSILATSMLPTTNEIRRLTGCKLIYSLQIPVSRLFQYEYNGFDGDLQLAWNDPSRNGDREGRSSSNSVLSIIISLIISTAILGALFFIACCLYFLPMRLEIIEANIQRFDSSNTRIREMERITLHPDWLRPQRSAPSMAVAQLDDSPFMSSTEVPSMAAGSNDRHPTEELMIGGNQCISGPNSDSCPVCLEGYQASERLRVICKCEHCFHADCLERWLQRVSSCPICRVTVD